MTLGVEDVRTDEGGGVEVSLFIESAEDFTSTMEMIRSLCRLQDMDETFDQSEIQRLSSMITFLKEWRYFCYEPKVVNFTYETESSEVKEDIKGINLPQFSSATVPERGQSCGVATSLNSKDFVLHAGGSVWALDWCPRMHEMLDCPVKCEYLAVAAHPPDSSYHNIGTPLTGRGIVQIWCLLNMNGKDESYSQRPTKASGSRQYMSGSNVESEVRLSRPKGRPRKRPVMTAPTKTSGSRQYMSGSNVESEVRLPRPKGRPRKRPVMTEPLEHANGQLNSPSLKKRGRPRRLPIAPEPSNVLNVVNNMPPLKRPRGRPRKRPDKSETIDDMGISEELSMPKFIPALAVDDTHAKSVYSLRRPRGRPRKSSDETGKVNSLHAVEDLSNSEIIPHISGNDSNAKSTPLPFTHMGRPKKAPETMVNLDIEVVEDTSITELVHSHAVENSNVKKTESSPLRRPRGRPRKKPDKMATVNDLHAVQDLSITEFVPSRCIDYSKTTNVDDSHDIHDSSGIDPILPMRDVEMLGGHVQDALESAHYVAQEKSLEGNNASLSLQNGVALPRVVLCLGHNGKVAWDVKWRPHNTSDVNFRHRIGYLAVLLGNGSLEVWEVPCPSIIGNLYKSSSKEGTDPRFLKLHPVFRCSKLKSGDRQSIPLTMEWSRSALSDLILVGCHDGTVALWKFSPGDSSQDTRPLLCFTADNAPIRAVAWAPGESDNESANLIVTAGHEGLKFWDVRDPFRPLWDFYPAQRIILSLDWLQHPSCLIFTLDDGTMKTLSLSKIAYDVPVTGKPFDGTKRGGVHNYYRSQFAIWSVQVSPITGIAAYCCADGSTLCFQITAKSVDKEKTRNRSPHFLCGTLMAMDHSFIIDTPMPYTVVAELPRPVHSKCAPVEDQILGEDPVVNLGNKHCEPSASKKRTPKTSKHSKSLPESQKVDPPDTVGQEEGENSKTVVMNTGPSNQNFLVLPPKIVAMHRVRWNVNRGSERWLCYGGAAGIIRCQEIALPFDF